jgi:phosphonoacetate hydrolase
MALPIAGRRSPSSSCVCIDGGDPVYLDQFVREGDPEHRALHEERLRRGRDGTVPSFRPNNMSIITGTPASRHGISGLLSRHRDGRPS